MKYEALVIGVSAGGLNALNVILPALPRDFPAPILIVQHVKPDSDDYLSRSLDAKCKVRVKEADEKEALLPGVVYIAPPNYHLLVEEDRTVSLTIDERVCYARPSVDVLFESAANVYYEQLVGLILTGANSDGSNGLRRVKELGGVALVQNPGTAESSMMPDSALKKVAVDRVVDLPKIASVLLELFGCVGKYGI